MTISCEPRIDMQIERMNQTIEIYILNHYAYDKISSTIYYLLLGLAKTIFYYGNGSLTF
jgi:hypothetical protein